ncbi:MAG TPA: CaiB/BaiF CoA-transferase family protein [Actinomycetes bacterium]|nr:CaiB/BaiF CoA-transferase family protein [Actinomycetes bacterium]
MATAGPLSGVRVVELAGLGPAPFAGMLLADLGSEVVRVDRPEAGPLRVGDPRFDLLGRGKRAIVVDLKQETGAATVLSLVGRADVVLEGFRPGVAERLGVGPAQCLARNPRLVYGRVTGWGQSGPVAATAGHDLSYLAVTGVLHAIGPAGGPPQIPLNLLGDYGGGALYLVVGVLAALQHAGRTGQGQVVDAAIVDGVIHLTTQLAGLLAAGIWRDARGVNLLDGGAPFYSVYETADERYLAVAALEPQFYQQFVARLGIDGELPEQYDPTGWPRLRESFAAAIRRRPLHEWTAVFDGTDACVSPVLTLAEARKHPQLVERNTFVTVAGVPQPAPAPRFSVTPAAEPGPPPAAPEPVEAVFADWSVERQ